MVKHNRENPNGSGVESITISYQREEAEDEAKSLHDEMCRRLRIRISPLKEIPISAARLGGAEILVAIVLSTIAKTALDAILIYLEEHFQRRHKKNDIINVQIIIKRDDTDIGKRFPFRLTDVKPLALKVLFKTIREFISRVAKEA